MKTKRSGLSTCAVGLAIALAAASRAGAAPSRMEEVMARARAEALAHPARIRTGSDAPDFGTVAQSVANVDAYEFQGANIPGDDFVDDGNGYRYLTASTSGGFMAAPVRLPSGVKIDEIGLNACIGDTGSMTVALVDAHVLGNPIELLGSLTSVGRSECFVQGQPIDAEYDQSLDHPLYVVIHWEGPMDGSMKFNSVNFVYHRLLSPAPQVATFVDVPTNHPFFQFIEALAASGITGGCGNGNFCPDQPLTRGQMAVFLSKALGLHWPN